MAGSSFRSGPIVATVVFAIALVLGACSSTSGDLSGTTEVEAADSTSTTPSSAAPPTSSSTVTDSTDNPDTTDSTDSTASTASTDGGPPASDRDDLPTTAAELAMAITEAELALRAPGVDQDSAAPWGRRQQALYRVLAFNPEWESEVLAAVDPAIGEAVALNWTARQQLISLVKSHSLTSTLPAWRIEEPPPADELLGYYREAEAASGVPWEILASINLVETRMGRIQGISSAGALGPMQFLPTTWAECCEGDPTNPRDAIAGAGKYLVQRGAETNLERAIFGYNNSDYYVTAVTSYAAVMEADASAYYGFHAWQVYYLSTEGLVVIPEGYEQQEPISVSVWLEANPDALFANE